MRRSSSCYSRDTSALAQWVLTLVCRIEVRVRGRYLLRGSHDAPINWWLYIGRIRRRIERIIGWYLWQIAIWNLVKTASFDNCDRNIGACSQPISDCKTRSASPNDLSNWGQSRSIYRMYTTCREADCLQCSQKMHSLPGLRKSYQAIWYYDHHQRSRKRQMRADRYW